jgi:SP family general alpha glucoside:H+ symporter-like MFS transporter
MVANSEDPAAGVLRTDNARLAHGIDNYAEVTHDAAQADLAEHNMSIREALLIHRKAVMWSMVLSAALIMEGYDVVVVHLPSHPLITISPHFLQIASFYEQPAFLKRFGVVNPATGEKLIPAPWQSGLGNGSSVGGIIGLMINGWASERFGPRRTYIFSMVGMIISIFGPVFSQSLMALTASEIICGLFWGGTSGMTHPFEA